jgi:hypothetical protein
MKYLVILLFIGLSCSGDPKPKRPLEAETILANVNEEFALNKRFLDSVNLVDTDTMTEIRKDEWINEVGGLIKKQSRLIIAHDSLLKIIRQFKNDSILKSK